MQHAAAKSFTAVAIMLGKSDSTSPAFRPGGLDTLYVSQNLTIGRGDLTAEFKNGDAVQMPSHLTPGTDYEVVFDVDRSLCVLVHGVAAERDLSVLGGFHYAPGGNALARAGGDAIPTINPFSIYDLNFRPACTDPRAMALVDGRFWCDIYLLGVGYEVDGTSRHGAAIADGDSLDKLDYATAKAIYAACGKQLLSVIDFWDAAYGVKEKASFDDDPETTGLSADDAFNFTSKWGLFQATGSMWVWGHDGDPDEPRASIFGGSWISGESAGSRYANLDDWPDRSFESIGARGRSDHLIQARQRSRPCRPIYPTHGPMAVGNGGQPNQPASANTLRGPVQRGVARNFGFSGHGQPCSRRNPRPAAYSNSGRTIMGKKYRNLIGAITDDATMIEAFRLTAQGKRLTPGYLEFKEFSVLNLDRLAAEMRRGEYVQGEPHQFCIFDPKHRVISALPFRDRVAQHALCAVIGPIFERTFLPRSYACRKGKGTHAGAMHVQADIRRLQLARPQEPLHFLKTDFSRYFASIDRAVLWRLIEAKISCAGTLTLLEAMVPRSGLGIPIGSLISQVLANIYGGALDRHLQQDLHEQHWFRYMDDLVVLGQSSAHLRKLKEAIEGFSREQLGLRFSKWSVAPVSRGVNFLGYRIWDSHKLLRPDSVVRAKRKIAAYRAAGDDDRLNKFVAAWGGHAGWADSRNLMVHLGLVVGE